MENAAQPTGAAASPFTGGKTTQGEISQQTTVGGGSTPFPGSAELNMTTVMEGVQSNLSTEGVSSSWLVNTTQPSHSQLVEQRWPHLLLLVLLTACLTANVLVLVAIACSRSLHRTIFYLLASLAVVDILHTLLVMSPALAHLLLGGCWWPGVWCQAWLGVEALLGAATLSHLCLAVCDSHAALLRPLQYQLRQVCAYSALNVLVTWLLALLLTTPLILIIILIPLQPAAGGGECGQPVCLLTRPQHVFTKLGTTLVLPVALLLGLYVCAHRAIRTQASVIAKMQTEAHSITTSNGDVTGLDQLEHDLVSEKTITQTIDICCQLAGVGPISGNLPLTVTPLAATANGHVPQESDHQEAQGDEHEAHEPHINSEDKSNSEANAVDDSTEDNQQLPEITLDIHQETVKDSNLEVTEPDPSEPKQEEASEPTDQVDQPQVRSTKTSPTDLPLKSSWNDDDSLPCVDTEGTSHQSKVCATLSTDSARNFDTPGSECSYLPPEASSNTCAPGVLQTMHQYYYSTFDEEINNPDAEEPSMLECVAEVHASTEDLLAADTCQPCVTDGSPLPHESPQFAMTQLHVPSESAFENLDTKYGVGTPPNTPCGSQSSEDSPFCNSISSNEDNDDDDSLNGSHEKLGRKRSKEILNGSTVEVADIVLTVQDTEDLVHQQEPSVEALIGLDNAGFVDFKDEDETPLATSIQVVHCPDITSPSEEDAVEMLDNNVYTKNGHLSHPPTRQPSKSSSVASGNSTQDGPHRSILRRDASQRSTVRKSVKFASTVSTKEIKPRQSNGRVPSGRKRVQRQGSLKNPNRVSLSRQNAIQQDDDNAKDEPKTSAKSSKKKKTEKAKKKKPCKSDDKKKDQDSSSSEAAAAASNNSPLSLLAGLQVSGGSIGSPKEYLAQLHQRQGQRMTLRVHRQRSILRLVTLMVLAYLALTLPHQLLQAVLSVCGSSGGCSGVSTSLSQALQWLAHSVSLINPLIYVLANREFRTALANLCATCCNRA